MGIIRTDLWLQKELNQPVKVCERLTPYFKDQKPNEVYQLLLRYGMYKPSRTSLEIFNKMVSDDVWAWIKEFYQRYLQKWSGPDIPVFIFPIDQARGFFRRDSRTKSGVSFADKMFLFLSPDVAKEEAEALFVHEYHHVCRLNKLKGNIREYTLLDSIIIEGLAEYAVLRNCGKKHLAEWCSMYTKEEMELFWERFLKSYLSIKKKERLHDELLYGHGRFPKLAGYAAGFSIVREYYQNHPWSTKKSFILSAESLINGTNFGLEE